MPQIAVTRLRLRHWRVLPIFLWHALASARQAQASEGFLGGWLGNSSVMTFWTATAWADEPAMRAFRDRSAHKTAMPRLLDWCDEAAVAGWEQASPDLPDGERAFRGLLDHGRTSKVRFPSEAHRAGRLAEDERSPRPGRRLVPRQRPRRK